MNTRPTSATAMALCLGLAMGAPVGLARADAWDNVTIANPGQSDLINPCDAYNSYEGMDSDRQEMKSRCDLVGEHLITRECLLYVTDLGLDFFQPPPEVLNDQAQACEATMPGILAALEANANAPSGPCRDRECREPQPVPVLETPTADGCGEGDLECAPPPQPQEIDDGTDQTGTAPAPAPMPAPVADAEQSALDLAFWQSIKDSANPVLFQAYLDTFPDGVFAPIAREWLRGQAATPPPPAANPDAGTAQAPSVLPPLGDDADGSGALEQANILMEEAYASDGGDWDAAARLAIPLYEQAGEKGQTPAWLALGDLYENGLGVAMSNDRALEYYHRAASAGYLDGYARAMLLLDQLGRDRAFANVFFEAYEANPTMALAMLDEMSQRAVAALQARLADEGFYDGALDGAFGPASRRALSAFLAHAPKPTAPATSPVAQPGPQAELTRQIQRELARVGCYHGAIDGKWGPATAQAMQNFNDWDGDDAQTDRPTEFALQMVTIALAPLCGVD